MLTLHELRGKPQNHLSQQEPLPSPVQAALGRDRCSHHSSGQ